MRIQLRATGLALSACRSFPAPPSPAHPADRGRDPNPELPRRAPGREPRQRRVDHPGAQILTVGPRHARPPSNTGRATRILGLGQEPTPDSEKTERALANSDHQNATVLHGSAGGHNGAPPPPAPAVGAGVGRPRPPPRVSGA